MYRLSDDLAKLVLEKMKPFELESSGNTAFLPKDLNRLGLIDPICCVGSQFHYILESPKPIIYQDYPFIPTNIQGYFLYKKEELSPLNQVWEISKVFVDPTCIDPQELIDVSDSAIVLPSDVEKLVAPTISTMEQLIKKEPMILDCLNLGKNNGK